MSTMTRRRCALSVPGSEPTKVANALASAADEVVVDLEDSVAVEAKERARNHVAELPARQYGSLTVRVNAPATSWHAEDLAACARTRAVTSVVLPKVESPGHVLDVVERLEAIERQIDR